MTAVRLAFDTSRLRQELKAEAERLARVQRRVVYAAAHEAVADLKAEMGRVFDRPTPWVLNGAYVAPQRGEASAEVAWRPGGGSKTTPAERILRAQVEGGPRRLKRFERLIGLPASHIAVPGKWAELDAYGNISGGQLVRIISALRLFGEVGYLANINAAREARRYARALQKGRELRAKRQSRTYFMVAPAEAGQLPPGIYRRAPNLGGAPLLIIAFVRMANYRARFEPARIVRESVARNIGRLWEQGLTRTLPTYRSR